MPVDSEPSGLGSRLCLRCRAERRESAAGKAGEPEARFAPGGGWDGGLLSRTGGGASRGPEPSVGEQLRTHLLTRKWGVGQAGFGLLACRGQATDLLCVLRACVCVCVSLVLVVIICPRCHRPPLHAVRMCDILPPLRRRCRRAQRQAPKGLRARAAAWGWQAWRGHERVARAGAKQRG